MMPSSPYLQGDDLNARLLVYFTTVYERYESLFEVLTCDEAYYKKPIALRHPLIFYYGHTATFFINKLLLAGLTKRIDPYLESICAVGVDEMSWDDLEDDHYTWPTVASLKEYRAKVKEVVRDIITSHPTSSISWNDPLWAVVMGIEHEIIHIETTSVLIRQHDLSFVRPHPLWKPYEVYGKMVENPLVFVPEGDVTLGKSKDEPFYGWDNEYGTHTLSLPSFHAHKMVISNGEFYEFVKNKGYETEAFWSEEGWSWKTFANASHPTFWVPSSDGFMLRLMCECVPMREDWPVEVNFHEAQAYCAWKAKESSLPYRLPTEEEFARMVDLSLFQDDRHSQPTMACHNLVTTSSVPVWEYPHGQFCGIVGNVWQWTQTPIYPFQGFHPHPYYDDFTTPTFDGRHALMAGSSWISCGNEAFTCSRYAFRRHFFQHVGFRPIVAPFPPTIPQTTRYENDPEIARLLHASYPTTTENFEHNLLKTLSPYLSDPKTNVLHVGCEVGGFDFLLAPYVAHIDAIEPSARALDYAVALQMGETVRYTFPQEEELLSYEEISLDPSLDPHKEKISFIQSDPANLKPLLTGYHVAIVTLILERLYAPALFLKELPHRVISGGMIVIVSSGVYSPQGTRLGGFKKDGESYFTSQAIEEILSSTCECISPSIPMTRILPQCVNLSHLLRCHVTIWKKR